MRAQKMKIKERRKRESKTKDLYLVESARTPPAVATGALASTCPMPHLWWVNSYEMKSPGSYCSGHQHLILFICFLFVSFLVIDSLYWASVAPFSLQDATVGRAFSASEVEPRILALRMTLPMMSTAPSKTMTAEETLCLCRTDTGSGAPATSARPAAPPGCSPFCPWTGRCTVLWIATAWSPWSGALLLSHLLLDSSCQRWGQWNLQLLARELWLVAGRNGFRYPHVWILQNLTFKGRNKLWTYFVKLFNSDFSQMN